MSPDTSELRELGRRQRDKRGPCKLAQALEALDPNDRDVIESSLLSDEEQLRHGARVWMENNGFEPPSGSALTPHRARKCRCYV